MDKEIDKIPKNPDTDIIIRIDEYMGRKGLTIREFVKSERYTGFRKAGTRIPADKFKVFKQAINSIDEKDMESPVSENKPADSGQGHMDKKPAASGKHEVEELEF